MEKTIEELQTETLAACAELGALYGGLVGDTIGGWTAADIQTGAQVAARITYIYANCMPSPQRAEALTKLAELLGRLENPGA